MSLVGIAEPTDHSIPDHELPATDMIHAFRIGAFVQVCTRAGPSAEENELVANLFAWDSASDSRHSTPP